MFPRYCPFDSAGDRQRTVTRGYDVFWFAPEQKGPANSRDAGDLGRHRVHYDVSVML